MILALVAAGAGRWAVSIPVGPSPTWPLPVERWWSGALSWIAHFTEYAILASLLWLALRSSPGLARHATAIAFGLPCCTRSSDELHQSFVPGRTPDARDWLVDLAGAALAIWLLSLGHAPRHGLREMISCLFAPVLLQ